MASVNEQIVRDYLEMQGFLVRQPRKYQVVARAKGANEEVDFLAVNPSAGAGAELPEAGVWGAREISRVGAALVAVRGWHSERFTAQMLAKSPDVYRFAEADSARAAEAELGGVRAARVLCLGSLPADGAARAETVAFLKSRGVDGVLLFRPMLLELAARIDGKKSYERSEVLQLLRILKAHGMLRTGQMDLFAGRRRWGSGAGKAGGTTEITGTTGTDGTSEASEKTDNLEKIDSLDSVEAVAVEEAVAEQAPSEPEATE
jgi:hypothetical protein